MLRLTKSRPVRRALFGLVALLVLSLAVAIFSIARQIERQSTIDEARSADVIIVLGAAEYRGVPSPVLKARLDHALELYRLRLAPYVMTTGGAGGDPVYTEGDVGRTYLTQRGIPSEAILVEREGESTVHSIAAAAEIMRRMNLHSCIVVSDGYHIFRVKKLLEFRGVQVYGSPRPGRPGVTRTDRWAYMRQAIGYLLWAVGISI